MLTGHGELTVAAGTALAEGVAVQVVGGRATATRSNRSTLDAG
jgi:hypothetical protein